MIQKLRNQLKKNNKGMSIITVIVAIGFAIIIVNILMLTSTVNYKMRNMNVYSKESFYTAEAVLDEIKIGMEQLVSDGLSTSYLYVLRHYNSDDLNSEQKNELVKRQFYDYMVAKLGYQVDAQHWKYVAMSQGDEMKGLYGLINANLKWQGTNISDSFGAFLRAESLEGTDYVGKMELLANDGIYLRDVKIYYRDENGFVSEIKTDIHVEFPDFSFANPQMPSISGYTFITDTNLTNLRSLGTETPYRNRTLTIKGDSFAYNLNTSGVNIDYAKSTNNAETHIVANELNVVNGGLKTYDTTTLWAGDIMAKSSKLELGGYTYVQDDLDLDGKGSELSMTGYYTGFGNSTLAGEDSSAILVNGTDAQIDLEYVKRISLAGRAYISTSSDNTEESVKKNNASWKNKLNAANKNKKVASRTSAVYTGQSIASKSDQLAYLIPADCIYEVDDAGNKTPCNSNPVFRDPTDTRSIIIDFTKPLSDIGDAGNTLGEYASTIGTGYHAIHMQTNDPHTEAIYFYIDFRDEEAANLYFAKYYETNKSDIDKYMEQYLKAITLPNTGNVALKINVAGNIIQDETAEGKTTRKVPGFIKNKEGYNTISETFEDDYEALNASFEGYCTKLTPNIENMYNKREERSGDNKALFINLVNEDILKDMTSGSSGGTVYYKDASGNNKVQLTYKANVDDVVAGDSDCDVIIANCGVSLSGSKFKGMVLAKGVISLPPSTTYTLEADPKAVNEALLLTSDDLVYTAADVFLDTDEMKFLATTKGNPTDYLVSDLVKFENWTKNVEVGK